MMHKCAANSYGVRIYFDSGQWYVGGDAWKDQYTIRYCPFCGEKLPPDEKIKVSRLALQDIKAELDEAYRQLEHCSDQARQTFWPGACLSNAREAIYVMLGGVLPR